MLVLVQMMGEETGMFTVRQTMGSVLCCKCGIPMTPNQANMCVKCLPSEVDITEGLEKHTSISFCPDCSSYLQPPNTWIKAQLESKQLLSFCLNKLKLKKRGVKLIFAEFVWTEPHSKRIIVKLKIQKEVLTGVILEQAYAVEYVVQDQLCGSCSRVHANPDQWVAAVQVRQHVPHRRTFFYLEQAILKHDAAVHAVRIKQMDHGVDFYFGNRSHALKFTEFLGKVTPVSSRDDRQLVSQDSKNNTYNYKYTFSVEICPICREDLICLPEKLKHSLGNLGPLVLCTKVSNFILLLDPFTLRHSFMNADQYWRTSFKPLLSSRQLVEYVILDVDTASSAHVIISGSKYMLAQAQVARVSDFGKNDRIFYVNTHLGHILKPGDYAMGYDIQGSNLNDEEVERQGGLEELADVVLVKKSWKNKRRQRKWRLKSLKMEHDNHGGRRVDEEKTGLEYEQFLRDLEENPEMRFNVSLYRNKQVVQGSDEDDQMSVVGDTEVDKMFADLDLSDDDDDGGRGDDGGRDDDGGSDDESMKSWVIC